MNTEEQQTKKPVLNKDTHFVAGGPDAVHPINVDSSQYTEKDMDQERGMAYRALLALMPNYGAVKLLGELDAMSHSIRTRFDIVTTYFEIARKGDSQPEEAGDKNEAKTERVASIFADIDLSIAALDALGRFEEFRRYRSDREINQNGIDEDVMDELINNGLADDISMEFAGEIRGCMPTTSGMIAARLFKGLVIEAQSSKESANDSG